jgi:hypothetical protein
MPKPWVLWSLLIGAVGCYLKPAWSNSPLTTTEGVTVRLMGQDCADHLASEGEPVTRDLSVRLRVENATDRPLVIRTGAIELDVDAGRSRPLGGDAGLTVGPDGARDLTLRFLHHARCDGAFVLQFANALLLGERPVTTAALHLRPR